MPDTEDLQVDLADGVLRLRFDRPEMLNALTGEMADALAEHVESATVRDDVRVLVIEGAGSAFCAGADISGVDAHEHFDVSALDRANRIVRAITSSPVPEVAAVIGVAAAAGFSK